MSAVPNTPVPTTEQGAVGPAKAIGRALAAALGLTAAWGLLAGAT